MNITQLRALYRLWARQENRTQTFREFRATAQIGFDCVMVQWCGMWVGIERDGYTHT